MGVSKVNGRQNPSGVTDRIKDDPMDRIDHDDLRGYVKNLYNKQFREDHSVTLFELWIGALLAKNYNNHKIPDIIKEAITQAPETAENDGSETITNPEHIKIRPTDQPRASFDSTLEERYLLVDREWARVQKQLEIQKAKSFWQEPKDLVVTLAACCIASLTQGWDQVANGNLGWPKTFNLDISPTGTGHDIWILGGANAITWFAAAIIGMIVVDPLCHSSWWGRRGAVFLAALFSFASVIGASQARSWQGYFVARLFLGIGIGAKASVVPIWESEILPRAKRGRLLVLWQVFTATGIFAGSVATYIFRDNWRNQVLTGAIPAFALIILSYLCCESPRWLILQGRYRDAFATLLKLRKERILALEEFCFIHFQVQAERTDVLALDKLDYNNVEPYVHYKKRVWRVLTFDRNRRAAIATFVVMISQQLSGINILAFLASIFFSAAGLRPAPTNPDDFDTANRKNEIDSLRLTIGFGVANALFSTIAYFLIERRKDDTNVDEDEDEDDMPPPGKTGETAEEKPISRDMEAQKTVQKKWQIPHYFLGRRNLLLWSLAGGAAMLFILTFLLGLPATNGAKMGAVMAFVIFFTFFYSPGAGAVPFVYSSEVWPNEGREIGMSWAVMWNFIGAGLLSLFVPRLLQWGPSKTFGLFTGFSVLGFILVWVFVPSTGPAMTLEEMSRKFKEQTRHYSRRKLRLGRKDLNAPTTPTGPAAPPPPLPEVPPAFPASSRPASAGEADANTNTAPVPAPVGPEISNDEEIQREQ